MNEILYLLILSTSSVIALFVIAKILGKKQVAQLEFIDYAVGISIGSIAAEMATDVSDKPFYYYLIAMAIYFIFDLSISLIGRKAPALKHFFKGKPITLIYNGQIIYKNLKKSKMDVNDLLTLARSQGYFNLKDIAFAVFEDNGNLSIMPKGDMRPTIVKDLDIKTQEAELPLYLVVDGVVSNSSLREIEQDKTWLFSQLKIKNKKQLKNIILAEYDSNKKKINVMYK